MKKLITLLSVLTLTSSTVSLTVACNNKEKESDDINKVTTDEANHKNNGNHNNGNHNNGNHNNGNNNHKEEKGLDLNSLNSSMFQKLDILPTFIGTGSIITKSINDINNDEELIDAIKSHIKVKLLKSVFNLNNLTPKTEAEGKALKAFILFVGATPSILNIDVSIIKPNKKYEVTIKKENWKNVKVDPLFNPEGLDLKPYYDLIEGNKAVFTVIRGKNEIVNEKEFNINNLSADMFKQLNIIDWDTFLISTKNINEINNNQEIVNAIESTIWVMILNKIFGFKGSNLKINDTHIPLLKFFAMYKCVMRPIIKLNLEQIEPNHKYILTIEKEKWGNIELNDEMIKQLGEDNKITLKDIKPYYDLIKGETTTFNITK